jgi:hypothetical protein
MRTVAAGLLAVVSLALSNPASARTTRVHVTGTTQVIEMVDPGRSWLSGPIGHTRGRQVRTLSTPDASSGLPVGVILATVNVVVDTRTFEGWVWGRGTVDYGDGGFSMIFAGDISPAAVPGGYVAESRFVGHGFGSYKGYQLRVTSREIVAEGSATFEGVLFKPGDN